MLWRWCNGETYKHTFFIFSLSLSSLCCCVIYHKVGTQLLQKLQKLMLSSQKFHCGIINNSNKKKKNLKSILLKFLSKKKSLSVLWWWCYNSQSNSRKIVKSSRVIYPLEVSLSPQLKNYKKNLSQQFFFVAYFNMRKIKIYIIKISHTKLIRARQQVM